MAYELTTYVTLASGKIIQTVISTPPGLSLPDLGGDAINDNFENIADNFGSYLELSGGTMTGDLSMQTGTSISTQPNCLIALGTASSISFFGDGAGALYMDTSPIINAGSISSTAATASTVPLSLTLAASQSAHALDITAHGGSAGGLFAVDHSGNVTATSFAGSASGLTGVPALITVAVQSLSASSNLVATNASYWGSNATTNQARLTLTSSSWTMSNPTSPADGQAIVWQLTQDGTGSRTVVWGSAFNWGAGSAPTLSTAANKSDYIVGRYNGVTSKWDMIGISLGF